MLGFFSFRGIQVQCYTSGLNSEFKTFESWKPVYFVSPYSTLFHFLYTRALFNYKRRLKSLVKRSFNLSVSILIKKLNYQIKNFKSVYAFFSTYNVFSRELDYYLYRLLWRFIKRCHPRRSNTWLYGKFWKSFSRNSSILLYRFVRRWLRIFKLTLFKRYSLYSFSYVFKHI